MIEVQGKKVTVVGLARTGVAVAKLLAAQGAFVTVTDVKPYAQLKEWIKKLPPNVKLVLGGHPRSVFADTDLIVISPGVPLDIPSIAEAGTAGKKIIGELELVYQLKKPKIVGITGTNGKSTTTTLIGRIFSNAGRRTFVGGNLGFPLAEGIEQENQYELWIVEISSFQLETIEEFRPYIAALLNLTPDHLDRYSSYEEYKQAKLRIFANQTPQDYAVLNADQQITSEISPGLRAEKIFYSASRELSVGVMVEDGQIVSRLDVHVRWICRVEELRLKGKHNLENALAATAVASLCGIAPEVIRNALREFPGLEHRLETVATIRDVNFVNDSKATTVESAARALESLTAPIILIAGGKDKGMDYRLLLEPLKRQAKALILIGQAREKMRRSLGGFSPIWEADSLENAVELGFKSAGPGDTILLSPACSSYDMFRDYEHRGRVFKETILKLLN